MVHNQENARQSPDLFSNRHISGTVTGTLINHSVFLFHLQGPAAPKDTLIMLVDCSESMFNVLDDDSPFQLSVKASFLICLKIN